MRKLEYFLNENEGVNITHKKIITHNSQDTDLFQSIGDVEVASFYVGDLIVAELFKFKQDYADRGEHENIKTSYKLKWNAINLRVVTGDENLKVGDANRPAKYFNDDTPTFKVNSRTKNYPGTNRKKEWIKEMIDNYKF